MKSNIGIMQGRLSDSPGGLLDWFPENCWEQEFYTACKLGYRFIEFIAERNHNQCNPIWSDSGIIKMKKLANETDIELTFLCNNYIIDHSFFDRDNSQPQKILERCKLLGIHNLVLPFFEASKIEKAKLANQSRILRDYAQVARKLGITLHIETRLCGDDLLKLISLVNSKNVYLVMDTGNYFVYNYDITKDIILFSDVIGHVHIKDRDVTGNNVLLGSGQVDFLNIFKALRTVSYKGMFTFETNRGTCAANTAKHNINYFNFLYNEATTLVNANT